MDSQDSTETLGRIRSKQSQKHASCGHYEYKLNVFALTWLKHDKNMFFLPEYTLEFGGVGTQNSVYCYLLTSSSGNFIHCTFKKDCLCLALTFARNCQSTKKNQPTVNENRDCNRYHTKSIICNLKKGEDHF